MSLPSRERGLKFIMPGLFFATEIVAPFAGARIEIIIKIVINTPTRSLPSRERGLK